MSINDHRRTGKPWRTSTGVVVGGAYTQPAPHHDADAGFVQAAMLLEETERQRPMDWQDRLVVWAAAICAVLTAIILTMPEGWLK